MLAAPTDSFCPYYGACDDGNIFNPANLKSLKDFVLKNTEDKGVHFMMADGVSIHIFTLPLTFLCHLSMIFRYAYLLFITKCHPIK